MKTYKTSVSAAFKKLKFAFDCYVPTYIYNDWGDKLRVVGIEKDGRMYCIHTIDDRQRHEELFAIAGNKLLETIDYLK